MAATARDILRSWVAILATWALVVQAVTPVAAAPHAPDARAICAAAMAASTPVGGGPDRPAHDDCCTLSVPPTALPPDGPPAPVAAEHGWIRLDHTGPATGVRVAGTPETDPLVPRGPPARA